MIIDPAFRAARAWLRINDKPSSITIVRDGVADLAAQTVRVEVNPIGETVSPALGSLGQGSVTVYGIRQHATLPDTDIRRGDRFLLGGRVYRITNVIDTLGERQATGEVEL
jgi:hypothetical protein